MKNTIVNIKFLHKNFTSENFSKNANQKPPHQSPPTTSQENPTTPTNTQNPQSSTRISFQDNPYTFKERHARLSEQLEPVVHHAPLSEPQYERAYNVYPHLQQDLNRVRHDSPNQNTLEINRQIIHPRRNRNFQTPRVHFNIPQSPTPNPLDFSSSSLPDTPPIASQLSTSNKLSDYLGSTPTSEQVRENPLNSPATTERLPFWVTHAYTQGEPKLVSNPFDVASDTTLSTLTEPLSLPSTPSLSQVSPSSFPLNFPTNLDSRYQEQSSQNIPLRLDWNTFVAPPPLFDQHQESNRLHNWATNRLQYRHDINKDIQEHNIQILQQSNLTLKFELTVRLNNIVQYPFLLDPPNITAQSLPPPFITTEIIY